ncbi:hypothetical protein [Acidithiobacillus sp.]
MGISYACELDDPDWYYEVDDRPRALDTKRSRKCVSCKIRIAIGDTVYRIIRWRRPFNDLEERIHGDEVSMSTWYFCPECAAIYQALDKVMDKVNACVDLGHDDLRDALQEFNEMYAPKGLPGFRLKIQRV